MTLTQLEDLDARIPKWNLNGLKKRNCPFCDSHNAASLKRPDKLSVAYCEACGCWYVDNLPSIEDVLMFYDGYFHNHRPIDLSGKDISEMLESAQSASEKNWQLQALLRLHTSNSQMRILDVGCGSGGFLLEARSTGADVVGCDLSPEACEFANTKLGILVHQSELHICASSIGEVDAVVMRDFIEHPIDPLVTIKAALHILKPGGLLLFHTPNGGEAGISIETARKWVGFRVDLEHLQYLSPHTVNWLSKEFCLRIEWLETSGFPSLKGINRLPSKKYQTMYSIRQMAKKIPGLPEVAKVMRGLNPKRLECNRDLQLGSYHLFAIFRKL